MLGRTCSATFTIETNKVPLTDWTVVVGWTTQIVLNKNVFRFQWTMEQL